MNKLENFNQYKPCVNIRIMRKDTREVLYETHNVIVNVVKWLFARLMANVNPPTRILPTFSAMKRNTASGVSPSEPGHLHGHRRLNRKKPQFRLLSFKSSFVSLCPVSILCNRMVMVVGHPSLPYPPTWSSSV